MDDENNESSTIAENDRNIQVRITRKTLLRATSGRLPEDDKTHQAGHLDCEKHERKYKIDEINVKDANNARSAEYKYMVHSTVNSRAKFMSPCTTNRDGSQPSPVAAAKLVNYYLSPRNTAV